MVSRPLDFVKWGSMGRFSMDYWVLEWLENVNKEIILKDDEHLVNIDLDKID